MLPPRPSPQQKPKKNEPVRRDQSLVARVSPYASPSSRISVKSMRKDKLRDLAESSRRQDDRDKPRPFPGNEN